MRLALLPVLLLAGLLLLFAVPHAMAKECRRADGVTRCLSVRPQTCVSGTPTVCSRSRNTCETRRSGWFRCTYVAKSARCRGFGGRRCQTTWTRCTTTPGRKRCTENRLLSCTTRAGRDRCTKVQNTCDTRGSRWLCVHDTLWTECAADGTCTEIHRTCRRGKDWTRPDCRATKVVRRPEAAPTEEGEDADSAGEDPGDEDAVEADPEDADPRAEPAVPAGPVTS